jgi:hypothetical protein
LNIIDYLFYFRFLPKRREGKAGWIQFALGKSSSLRRVWVFAKKGARRGARKAGLKM